MKEGEPTYVVTRLDNHEEYSEDLSSEASAKEDKPQETEKINQNIAEWKDSETAAQNDEKDQEVKIEDLPF